MKRILIGIFLGAWIFLPALVLAASCDEVIPAWNAKLAKSVDAQELIGIVRSLNSSDNKKLPPKFVTKRQAREAGWKPGKDLWSVKALKGSSIGGDRFANREARLPEKHWREADLHYRGGRRGAERIVFSRDGKRFVTVDHYRTFTEVPACR
ncbi:MAG: hypothetical protein M0042_09935 [Nitrospiraceae bacterium]|nr:hypothetical protein [Nitrospiraceae bacterium]